MRSDVKLLVPICMQRGDGGRILRREQQMHAKPGMFERCPAVFGRDMHIGFKLRRQQHDRGVPGDSVGSLLYRHGVLCRQPVRRPGQRVKHLRSDVKLLVPICMQRCDNGRILRREQQMHAKPGMFERCPAVFGRDMHIGFKLRRQQHDRGVPGDSVGSLLYRHGVLCRQPVRRPGQGI